MKYPALPMIVSEDETLAACAKMSIARYGDGELRLAIGRACSSQRGNDALRRELERILTLPTDGLMVGIPNFEKTPRQDVWTKYAGQPFLALYTLLGYGSSFITRPDNAPWIDRPDYWNKVRALWQGKDITLVVGDEKSITRGMLLGANSVRSVMGPRQHAYTQIDTIEEQIGRPGGTVLLCLGATATVLAGRLARKGVHALDLGHIGMFMRHAGAYVEKDQLISDHYIGQNLELHQRPEGFGGSGKKHVDRVLAYARELPAKSILDYGSGEGTLSKACKAKGWTGFFGEYDPGMPGKLANLPKPAELLVCTDVLEHIEPDYLDNVLRHMLALTGRGAFLTIATRPANKVLPDGRNAHLIQQPAQWWITQLIAAGFMIERFEQQGEKEVWIWARKASSTEKSPSLTGPSST